MKSGTESSEWGIKINLGVTIAAMITARNFHLKANAAPPSQNHGERRLSSSILHRHFDISFLHWSHRPSRFPRRLLLPQTLKHHFQTNVGEIQKYRPTSCCCTLFPLKSIFCSYLKPLRHGRRGGATSGLLAPVLIRVVAPS